MTVQMTRGEMLDLLAQGISPRAVSLEKWQRITEILEGSPEQDEVADLMYSNENCAYCHIFGPRCLNCPLAVVGDRCPNSKSSWQRFNVLHYYYRYGNFGDRVQILPKLVAAARAIYRAIEQAPSLINSVKEKEGRR